MKYEHPKPCEATFVVHLRLLRTGAERFKMLQTKVGRVSSAQSYGNSPTGFPVQKDKESEDSPVDDRAAAFQQLVDNAAEACAKGDYEEALEFYDTALELDPKNHVLFSNRSAIFCKLARYDEALESAERSLQLNPKWSRVRTFVASIRRLTLYANNADFAAMRQAFYRKGNALKCSGSWQKALVTFSAGLAADPRNKQLLTAAVECARSCPLQEKFSGAYLKMSTLGLEKSAFLVVSAIGQELLSSGAISEAVNVLESALQIDSTSLTLKQSVLSALSSAHWTLGNEKLSLQYLQQDLAIAETLDDVRGKIRARRSLGYLCLKLLRPIEALEHFRLLVELLIEVEEKEDACEVMFFVSQIYQKSGNLNCSLTVIRQCLDLAKQWELTKVFQTKVAVFLGNLHLTMGNEGDAKSVLEEAVRIAEQSEDVKAETDALVALGEAYLHGGTDAFRAKELFVKALKILQKVGDVEAQCSVCSSLVISFWKLGNLKHAEHWARRQLELSLKTDNQLLEARACESLAFILCQIGEYQNARKLYHKQVELAKRSDDSDSLIRAFRALGICSAKLKLFNEAVEFHSAELLEAQKCGSDSSECLARASLCLPLFEIGKIGEAANEAELSLELADSFSYQKVKGESYKCLAEFHIARGSIGKAIELYEKHLMIAQELNCIEDEMNACQSLGEAHFKILHYREALRYFAQFLAIAKELRDHKSIAVAYCMLGRSQFLLGKLEDALECHRYSLATSHVTGNVECKAEALLYVAEVLTEMRKSDTALKVSEKALNMAKLLQSPVLESKAYSRMSAALLTMSKMESSMSFLLKAKYSAEQSKDPTAICEVLGKMGDCHRRQGMVSQAVVNFQKQAEFAGKHNLFLEKVEALRSAAETSLEAELVDDALRYYQERLDIVKKSSTDHRLVLLENCLFDLASCYEKKKHWKRAASTYKEILAFPPSIKLENVGLAHYGLGWGLFNLGNFPGASEEFAACLESLDAHQTEFRIQILKLLAYCAYGSGLPDLCASHLKNRLCLARTAGVAHHELCALIDVAYMSENLSDALHVADTALKLARAQHYADAQLKALEYMVYCKEAELNLAGARLVAAEIKLCAQENNLAKAEIVHLMVLGVLDFDQHHFDSASVILQEALDLAVAVSDIQLETEIRLWLGIVLWASDKLEKARMMLESAWSLAISHCPLLSSDGFLRHDRCKISLQETIGVLLLALLVSANLATESLRVAEMLRKLRLQFASESLGFSGHSSCNTIEMNARDVSQSCLACMQVENVLILWTIKHGSVSLVSFQMKNYNLNSISNSLLPGCKLVTCPGQEFPRSHLVPAYQLQLPYHNAELIASALVVSSMKCFSLEQAKVRLEKAIEAIFPTTGFLLVVGFEAISGFPFDAVLQSKATANGVDTPTVSYDLQVSDVSNKDNLYAPCTSAVLFNAEAAVLDKRLADIAHTLSASLVDMSQIAKADLFRKLKCNRTLHLKLRWISAKKAFLLNSEDGATESLLTLGEIAEKGLCASLLTVHVQFRMDDDASFQYTALTIATMLRAFGCSCVLLVGEPESNDLSVSEFFLQFYEHFVGGASSVAAFCAASRAKQRDDAVYYIFGREVFFDNKATLIGAALRPLLATPDDCRETFQVALHLIEKSLQRITTGELKAMFTNESCIRNKVGAEIGGWQNLLEAVGFRRELTAGDDAVWYFPQGDPDGLVFHGSYVLQALLGKSMFLSFKQRIFNMETLNEKLEDVPQCEVTVSQSLWKLSGVPILFRALGFNVVRESDVGCELKAARVNLTKKKLSMAVVALKAMFNSDVDEKLKKVNNVCGAFEKL
ncbi:hypothetical protein M513_04934 [Trichuris suis]|uniref:Uncharacterized protein n=1 Tax=Trichuris suis TaxID=68888 RepID=A0A085MAB1_9BILA|nr:hypothetical protein M513_04934 [Trichuris suis]